MKKIIIILSFNLIFGNYSIVNSNSKVEYFGSHPIHKFSGLSSLITMVTICDEEDTFCDLTFTIPIMSLNSGNDNRDSNMLNYLNAFMYPEIILNIKNFHIKEYRDESILSAIYIHGIQQKIKIPITLVIANNQYKVSSSFNIQLEDFNIPIPKLLFIPINNMIKINVELLIENDN